MDLPSSRSSILLVSFAMLSAPVLRSSVRTEARWAMCSAVKPNFLRSCQGGADWPQRHIPAGKGHQFCPKFQVPVKENCSFSFAQNTQEILL